MLDEAKVTVNSVLAGVCWLAGLAVACVDLWAPVDLTGFVVLVVAAASVLTLRAYMTRSQIATASVFQLGRETERRQGPRGV